MTKADILIKNGLVLTMDQNFTFHEKADIAILDGKIIDIAPQTKYIANKTIDAKNKLVMPGLINTHSHAAMTLLRGAADDLPLDTWLQKVIFPIEAKYSNKEFVEIGSVLAAIEMIKSGTTCFSDMYYFEDIVAEVCSKIGIRVFVGEGLLDFKTPSSKSPEEGLEHTKSLFKKWKDHPLVSVTLAPHAPYSCSEDIYKKVKTLSDELNIPIHTHLSETANEVAEMRLKCGLSPIGYLESIGLLCNQLIAVHCVHLSHEDIKLLRKYDVKVSHCGESNMKLASGNAPIIELLENEITVGLGTDGAASNNNLDMFDEMDVAAKLHKLIKNDPAVMDAKTVLRMATTGGAKTLGRQDLGSLEIGKAADIIIIDLNAPHLTPIYNPYSHLVYSAGGNDVQTSIINGKVVMENRKVLTANEQDIIDAANKLSKKIILDIPKF